MAAPTFGALGTAVSGSGTTVSVPVPASVVSGSIVVAVVHTNGSSTISGMGTTGMVHLTGSPVLQGGHTLNVMWKRATGADAGTYDFTQSASDFHEGVAVRYDSAVATGSPWDTGTGAPVATSTATATTAPALSLTTTAVNALILNFSTQFNGGTWTASSGFTQRFGTAGSGPNHLAFGADVAQAVAGSTGSVAPSVSASAAGMTNYLAALLSVAPSGSNFTGTPSDPVGITDSAATAMAAQRTQGDPVGITDSVTGVITRVINITITDNVGITDTGSPIDVQIDYSQTVSDNVGITDATASGLNANFFTASPGDLVGIVDVVVAVLSGPTGPTFLFTPPQRKQTTMMVGSLRYSYQVSETVWKDANGVWQHQETPAGDILLDAQRLMAYGGRPEIVDQATAIELTAAGIGTIQIQ